MKEIISIVVPCYNEEESIPRFYDEINSVSKDMNKVNFEFIFVNDGSKDNTLKILKELNKKDKRVKYISFSRNFGKESAMYAGLEYSKGDYVAIMDADLQDPPYLLKEMYETLKEKNFDCVATRRVTRKGEPVIRSFFARCFYKIINKMSKSLVTHTVDIDEQKLINEVEKRLYESKETAYKIVNNNFFKSSSYYTDYINMRINQFDTIKRMRLHFERFNIPVEQMKVMSDFTLCVSENIREINDCEELLNDLESLRSEFKRMELPKSREEFESRAQLLQFLNDMEDFLVIKRNFFKTTNNH